MKGSLPRPFSPTDAKRDREEKARMAERGLGTLHGQVGTTVALVNYTNEELTAALEQTRLTLEAADAQIAAATAETEAARVELEAALTASDAAQAQLATDLGVVKDTTLPALDAELTAAQGRLDTAETSLGTVDTRIETAKSTTLVTAAATAQTKADAAAAEAKRQLDLVMSSGASLVINGGFESDDIWTTNSVQVYDTAEKRTGARSMKMTPTTGNVWSTNAWFDGATGRTYRVEFWIKRSGGTSVASAVGAVFQCKTTAGGTSTTIAYPSPTVSSLSISTTDFTKVTVDYTIVTANTVQVRVAPWVRLAAGNTYWVDDITAYDITEAKAALDAANSATAAATSASSAAGAAQGTADAALNAATHTGKNLFGTTVPTGTAPHGTVWMQKGTGDVIIGQWQQTGGSAPDSVTGLGGVDGSTWTKRDIDNAMIANLDVGKLVANTAVVNTAVAEKIAASTAAIQKADIGNLTVTGTSSLATLVAQQIAADSGQYISLAVSQLTAGTASMGVGVIDKLYSEVVNSRKIIADQMILGSGANSHPDPKFLDASGWSGNYIVGGAGRNGGNGLVIPASATQAGSYYGSLDRTRHIAVTPGAYRVSAWVKASGIIPIGGAAVYAKWSNPAGSTSGAGFASPGNVANTASIAANTWFQVDGIVTVPSTAETMFIGLYKQASANVQMTWSEPSIQPAISSSLVATGAILAPHITASEEMSAKLATFLKVNAGMLEAEIVLGTKILAGPANGTHAEMTPEGFRVFAADPLGGPAREVVRLGVAASSDFLAVTNAAGELVTTVDETGKTSSVEVHAKDKLTYRGEELATLLNRLPQGVQQAAYRDTSSTVNATPGANIPFLRLETTMYPGRLYKVWTSPIKIGLDAGAGGLVGIKYNAGALATLANGSLTEGYVWDDLGTVSLQELVAVGSSPVTMSFLIWLGAVGGAAGFRPSPGQPVRLVVEDVGPLTNNINSGVHMNGTVAPAAPKNTYVRQYPTSTSMNYLGSNAQYNFDLGHMYQGLQPGTSNGNLKSIAITAGNTTDGASILTDLSGATVNYARVYFGFQHWYNNSGGTARIGLHGHTAVPASFSGSGIAATSGGWPKPGARWVDLPSSVFAGLKSGAYRGVYLEGDNTYTTYGYADRPTIEIGFTK